ncbi:protein farnesyltransferase subunit beta isoform X1 [Cavia porcellus]|uniref:Protein farnesyltransferase subunit beta n=1 Tax=Cavia porcellus TaxID=10141 RepID=A0A286XQ56_CAVPO|nr:protein farnesyltransferase subunit beta [Cavia porcellus]XP_005004833.1 protein farnesyltransferase subunit beta [Cavia porcellus]
MASPSSFTYYCPPTSSPVWPESLYSLRPEHARERLLDDSVDTVTSREQTKVEEKIQEIFNSYKFNHLVPRLILQREKHFHYLKRGLRQLTDAYECLDASRPWLCYWILHSLELLDEPIPQIVATDVCQFLELCQSPDGGFGGGPGQHPHLAPTYAAVNALCIIGTEEAYDIINREKLLQYLYSLKQPDGSFLMHVGGEVDARSAYCAASVASLTNIITPDLFEGTAEWIARCQNWEGGIGGVPGMEAHGGYTFCGLAALVILKKEYYLNLKSLLQWVTSRQMRFEGGFQGRCNKLVDGCYSFWQAGLLTLLHRALHTQGDTALSMSHWMFHQQALQEYLLMCCQCPAGGLLDKPGKSRDFYHTCYCLSGLSIAQHFGSGAMLHDVVVGVPENALQPTHPVYNIGPDKVIQATTHFLRKPVPGFEEPEDEGTAETPSD